MNETGQTENGLKQWVRDYVDGKVDRVIEFMHKVEVHLDYTASRFDARCEKLTNHEIRIKGIEDEIDTHNGQLSMLRWIGSSLTVIAIIAVAVVASGTAEYESDPFKAGEYWHGNWAVNTRFSF